VHVKRDGVGGSGNLIRKLERMIDRELQLHRRDYVEDCDDIWGNIYITRRVFWKVLYWAACFPSRTNPSARTTSRSPDHTP
jgi:hypothetical protein